MEAIVADIGTTNVKAGLFIDGRIKAFSKKSVSMYIQDGVAEQNLHEVYEVFSETVREVSSKSSGRIDAIILSSQMHGIALLDRNGEPLTNLITYFDTRAEKYVGKLEEYGEEIYKETGCPPLYIYPLPKILLLKEKIRKGNVRYALSAKDYILYRLTGHHVLDKSTASGSQLLDIHRLTWSHKALDLADVEESQLPILVDGEKESFKIVGEEAERLGLSDRSTVYPGISDAAAHQLGTSLMQEKILALNVGTSAAVRVVRKKPLLDSSDKMRFFCYYGGFRRWLIGGAVNNGARVLDWFIDRLMFSEKHYSVSTGINIYDLLDRIVENSPTGSNGVLFIPYLSGERFPVRNSRIRGIIYGLSYNTSRADIIRAILEGVSFTLKWVYDAIVEEGAEASIMRGGGGGLRLSSWRKIFANIFNLKLEYLPGIDATLLGDYIALSISHYREKSLKELEENYWKNPTISEPNVEEHEKYMKIYHNFLGLYDTINAFTQKSTL